MIWVAWRQFRTQALVGGVALAALASYLFVLGQRIRDSYQELVACTGCTPESAGRTLQGDYGGELQLLGFLVLLLPALAGAFWGAPLVARESESGTHRLAWSQSVTRTRWLAWKLAVVVLAAAVITGALSALLTWAASPYDQLVGSRFEPLLFGSRNLVPLGYAVFATVAGITIGIFARRTVLAMAITLAAFAVVQILVPAVVRPHLQTPITENVPFRAAATHGISTTIEGLRVDDYEIPGAWVLTPDGLLLDRAGQPVARDVATGCLASDGPEKAFTCLEDQGLLVAITYQPAAAYWTIQWLEFALYLVFAGLLAALAFWKIRRG